MHATCTLVHAFLLGSKVVQKEKKSVECIMNFSMKFFCVNCNDDLNKPNEFYANLTSNLNCPFFFLCVCVCFDPVKASIKKFKTILGALVPLILTAHVSCPSILF